MSDNAPGWPIYKDPIERKLPSIAGTGEVDWYPATKATESLWRCFIALKKVLFAVPKTCPGEKEIREHFISLAVPVDDLFVCIRDHFQAIEDEAQTRSRLSDVELDRFRELRTRYTIAVLDHVGPIKKLRNKLGAHTDKKLSPGRMSTFLDAISRQEVGALLHAAILAFKHLVAIDCYAWSSAGYRLGEIRLMTNEPTVLNLTEDLELVGFEFTESPRNQVLDLIADVVEKTQWMFDDEQTRLVVNEIEAQDGE